MITFNSKEELERYIKDVVMTTSEVLHYLGISRPGLKDLIERGKLKPFKEEKATRLFFRSDVEARKREAEERRKKYRPYE
ncbi:helix-turn-helix domain-containing protein [Brevibacillus thermoruber]|jgi:predicted XRE-type DNA-binding protein|uniref:Helix-turn-helix domain-containing protein n=1 Tax=Brevibacillus thermoruber TaxID=33942 RepID=A0A9X3TTW9_9BACL|nr:helix-turn-helix domain-containing protein [Brevibacillus thermoruber]MDA5110531.1 helix-turn-helix domain-containing protein [Brevibacillus thermoruber]